MDDQNGKTFSGKEAYIFLKELGLKIGKTKVYADINNGNISCTSDKRVRHSDLLIYAESLKPPDLALLHNKLGLSYKWLVTGEGDPFDEGMENKPTSSESATPDMQAELEGLRRENVELNVEFRGALKELRRLNEERRELEERLKANTIDPGPFAFDPPAESVSAGRPARGVSGADVLGQCNK